MIDKVNLKAVSDDVQNLFEYLKVGTLNDHMLNIIKVENRTLDFHVHETIWVGLLQEVRQFQEEVRSIRREMAGDVIKER